MIMNETIMIRGHFLEPEYSRASFVYQGHLWRIMLSSPDLRNIACLIA
jgi:hypothetical protein